LLWAWGNQKAQWVVEVQYSLLSLSSILLYTLLSSSPLSDSLSPLKQTLAMDSLQATYKDEEDEEDEAPPPATATAVTTVTTAIATDAESPEAPPATTSTPSDTPTEHPNDARSEPDPSDELSDDDAASDGSKKSPKSGREEGDASDEEPPPKKQKQLSSLTAEAAKEDSPVPATADGANNATTPATNGSAPSAKKSKKKNNNVWATKSTRKGKKKNNRNNNTNGKNDNHANGEDNVLITPVPRFPDKSDDTAEMKICLSKVYKAEKVELSEDRMSAGSTKGYRMVRATRGVVEGAWYFEIRVVKLGESGHTRLGWSTEKGDLQAPVGYDGNSFGYRDIDGSKIHKASKEKYGEEGYKEGDVIGFYINLPDGKNYAPNTPQLVWYKGQRYVCAQDAKEDPPKAVPGQFSTLLFSFHDSHLPFSARKLNLQ